MINRFQVLVGLALIGLFGSLTSCSHTTDPIGSIDRSTVTSTVMRHYHRHAGEQDGYCRRPYIDNVTKIDLVEDTPTGLVVDVRYSFRDRIRDDDDKARDCQGFGSRLFTLRTVGSHVEVVTMSGTACKGLLFSLDRVLGLGNDRERLCP